MMGDTDMLFDLSEFEDPNGGARSPETQAEKERRRIEFMQERDLRNLERKLNEGKTLTAAEASRLEAYRKKYETMCGVGLPEHMVRTQKEVALHFQKNIRTIKRWVKRGMPANPDSYDLKNIEKWALQEGLIQNPIEAGGPVSGMEAGHGDPDPAGAGRTGKAHWDERDVKARAKLRELRLEKEKGRLVDVAEVKAAAFTMGRQVRDGILNVVDRVADILAAESDPRRVRKLLEGELLQALEVLSK